MAGFVGPLIFAPEANQGPLVGVFISGPGGAALGLAAWTAMRILKLSDHKQKYVLVALTASIVFSTLVGVQPSPSLEGFIVDVEVKNCRTPANIKERFLAEWDRKITKVSWAQPRSGWRQEMSSMLESAPGIIVDLSILRKKSVHKTRKIWNRGQVIISDWAENSGSEHLYSENQTCLNYPVGLRMQKFQRYDLSGLVSTPSQWPPTEGEKILRGLILEDIPSQF